MLILFLFAFWWFVSQLGIQLDANVPACSRTFAHVSSPKSEVMKNCMLSNNSPYILPSFDNLLLHHAEHCKKEIYVSIKWNQSSADLARKPTVRASTDVVFRCVLGIRYAGRKGQLYPNAFFFLPCRMMSTIWICSPGSNSFFNSRPLFQRSSVNILSFNKAPILKRALWNEKPIGSTTYNTRLSLKNWRKSNKRRSFKSPDTTFVPEAKSLNKRTHIRKKRKEKENAAHQGSPLQTFQKYVRVLAYLIRYTLVSRFLEILRIATIPDFNNVSHFCISAAVTSWSCINLDIRRRPTMDDWMVQNQMRKYMPKILCPTFSWRD